MAPRSAARCWATRTSIAPSEAIPFLAPFFEAGTEHVWGGLWNRPGLELRYRSLVVVTTLAATGHLHELQTHLRGALNLGWSGDELREALLQMGGYAGFPAAVEALRVLERPSGPRSQATHVADLNLSFAISPYDRVLPLISGEVKPSGIRLEYEPNPSPSASSPVPRMFFEQIKYQRYDVSEMSFSSYLIERPKGFPYLALPVFHNRNFRYTNLVVRDGSGIRQDHPEDLKGKRFSIPDYQMSMALWTRGILQHEFNILPRDLRWFQTRGQHFSHTGASGTQLPEGVQLTFANAAEADLFARAEVDVSMSFGAGSPGVRTLFSDPQAEATRFYKKDRHLPTPPHHGRARKHRARPSMGSAQPGGRVPTRQDNRATPHARADAVRIQPAVPAERAGAIRRRSVGVRHPRQRGGDRHGPDDLRRTGTHLAQSSARGSFPESVIVADESTIGL